MGKIADNTSVKELLDQIRALDSLEALYNAVPFARRIFPGAADTLAQFQDLKKQAEILLVPDQFNTTFSSAGWIAYESMNLDAMVSALSTEQDCGMAAAEQLLADYYNEEALRYGIMRFHGHAEFRRRIRLIDLARDDYLAKRYHACIPLLLALLDGLVADISKHVGFFTDSVDLTAWDSIVGHENGLTALAKIMGPGRNKINDNPISIPFRNGILHGRELAFDNHLVAAKCWAAMCAVRDWAEALANGKRMAKPKEKISWSQLLQRIAENDRLRKALDSWRPREAQSLAYLPHSGSPAHLPEAVPERAVAEFIENWRYSRFGLMADMLLDFLDTPKGKKAGRAKEDFGKCQPVAYTIVSVSDEAPAISQVEVDIVVQKQNKPITYRINVRVVYNAADNHPAMRGHETGNWRIVQNGFSKLIYAPLA